MSALLDEQPTTGPAEEPARRLRSEMAAVRLSFTWFGTRKTLTSRQKARAAESFGASRRSQAGAICPAESGLAGGTSMAPATLAEKLLSA